MPAAAVVAAAATAAVVVEQEEEQEVLPSDTETADYGWCLSKCAT